MTTTKQALNEIDLRLTQTLIAARIDGGLHKRLRFYESQLEQIRSEIRSTLAALDAPRSDRELAILALAKDDHEREGECEIDDNAALSEGDDNGCYVQAWVWVSFSGTQFDKEAA